MPKNARIQRIDRRRFLLGSAGSMLALPMLEAHAPRLAFGADAAPPKRLVIMHTAQGRAACNGQMDGGKPQDVWSPLTKTGALPASGDISRMLAALGDVRNEIVSVDGVDNWVRHLCNDEDGHLSSELSSFTCMPITRDKQPGGPSIDYVAGQFLRASSAQRAALIFPAGPAADWEFGSMVFFGAGGTAPTFVDANPADAIPDLFGAAMPTNSPPPKKTLHDRLVAREGSILDAVAKDYDALKNKVSASDRDRLEQHAAFIRSLETTLGGGGPTALAQGCTRPDPSAVPKYTGDDTFRGNIDGKIVPYQIENLVMSLACDITRTASLHFHRDYDPTFASEFPNHDSVFEDTDWHSIVHENQFLTDPQVDQLVQAYQYFGKQFTILVKRLAEVTDTDGSRLLDNTLVLWVSELGYGASHANFNMPIVLAGMGSAFAQGQGRHLVTPRRSLGDLYAQVLRMLGQTDTMTFGTTGTIGDGLDSQGMKGPAGAQTAYDEKLITRSLNLHAGPLDL